MSERNFSLVRQMGSFNVLQRTSDGMFNASSLLKQWNAVKGNKRKKMYDFLSTKPTQEFIQALRERLFEKRQKLHGDVSPWLIINNLLPEIPFKVELEEVVRIKKNKGMATKNGKVADEVWMHPLLFIKFACWINPRFEVSVLEFVQDQLIMYRNRIADSHRKWTDMLQLLGCRDKQYAEVQKAMNLAVFGESYEGIRDFANEEQLLKMSALEQSIEQAVSFGLIKDLTGVGSYLNKVYEQDFPQ